MNHKGYKNLFVSGVDLNNAFMAMGREMNLTSYSQSAQDLFVLTVLDRKEKGKYWEIGSSVPTDNNNTYLLESKFGWKGSFL